MLVLLGLVAALAVVLLDRGSAGTSSRARRLAPAPSETTATRPPVAPAAVSSARRPATATHGPSALSRLTIREGKLPQTHTYPSAHTAHFAALMRALWSGVVHDSVNGALPAFFPRDAYIQLKAIYGAGSLEYRLVGDYRLDIGAAHALLGADVRRARLVSVHVPSSYGHWVPPGACYNSIGYYEVPNARVLYREAGRLSSFGIASMISWRGVWYVVHMGSVLRRKMPAWSTRRRRARGHLNTQGPAEDGLHRAPAPSARRLGPSDRGGRGGLDHRRRARRRIGHRPGAAHGGEAPHSTRTARTARPARRTSASACGWCASSTGAGPPTTQTARAGPG